MKKIFGFFVCVFITTSVICQTQYYLGGILNVYGSDSVVANGLFKSTTVNATYFTNGTDTVNFVDLDYVTDPPHAYMFFWDSAYVLDMTQNEWIIVSDTGRADSLWIKDDFDVISYSGDTVIAPNFVTHNQIDGHVEITGGVNDVFQLRVMTSNDGAIYQTTAKINVASGYYYLNVIGVYWEATANAKVWLEIRNTNDNDDVTLLDGSFRIIFTHNDN